MKPAFLPSPRPFQPVFQHLPETNLPYGLNPEQVQQYFQRGFVVLRQVLTDEDIADLRAEAARLVETADISQPNLRIKNPGSSEQEWVWKVDPCCDVSPLISNLCRDRRLTDKLRSLYGGYAPRLFKDKLIIKPPHSHGNGLHQDYNWWQGFPQSLLSVSIPLDSTNRENGCTEMWTGWQRGFLHQAGTLDGQIDRELLKQEEHVYVEMEPGDMAIFHSLTPHAASPNETESPRRVLFLSFNDCRDGEHRTSHYEHYFGYLGRRLSDDERPNYFW